jgi:hypothetical protein
MNRLLRLIAKDLRHLPLSNLASQRIHLPAFDTLVDSISAWLASRVQYRTSFHGPNQKLIGFAVAKYGILDLTYSVEQANWEPDDLCGTALLIELGFAADRESDSRDMAFDNDNDPTCLELLKEDLDEH